MNPFSKKDISILKDLYVRGDNILDYLREKDGHNKKESILLSYDLQAGSYVKEVNVRSADFAKFISTIGKIFDQLEFHSLLEVGVGEATTLVNLLANLKRQPYYIFGFDISWSRIKVAKQYANENNCPEIMLTTGDLFQTPFADNSIDLVYTSHSLEPNGGFEREAVKELLRITKKYLILLEPDYELANIKNRHRMERLGYVKDLSQHIKQVGGVLKEHFLLGFSMRPENPTGVYLIEKKVGKENKPALCCPWTQRALKIQEGVCFSNDGYLVYPIIKEIPCLLPENAILATNFNGER